MSLQVVIGLGIVLVVLFFVFVCYIAELFDLGWLYVSSFIVAIISILIVPCVLNIWYTANFNVGDTIESYELIDKDSADYIQVGSGNYSHVYVVYKNGDFIRHKNIDDIRVCIIDDDSKPRLERVNTYYGKIKSKSWIVYLPEGY